MLGQSMNRINAWASSVVSHSSRSNEKETQICMGAPIPRPTSAIGRGPKLGDWCFERIIADASQGGPAAPGEVTASGIY